MKIKLTKGYTATVSRKDYSRVAAFKWFAQENKRSDGSIRNVYASRHSSGKPRKTIYLHRFILGLTNTYILVDHRNGDSLNCTRRNMRTATKTQNTVNSRPHCDNTSGMLGVSWDNKYKKWTVRLGGKFHGYFASLCKAKTKASKARAKHYGRFNRR